MKKSNLFFSAIMALAVGSLTGCTSDDLEQSNIVTPELTQSFANISIVMPNHAGTRVDDGTNVDDTYQDGDNFEYGTAAENKIGSILLVFYDAQGNVVGTSAPTDLGDKNTQTGGSVATVYKNTIELKLNEGANLPAQVMAYVNPANRTSQTDVLSRILTLTRTKDQLWNTDGFLMNNSVYYENGLYKVATEVNPEFIYATEEEAKENAGSAAEIYVERVAAKIKVAMNPEGIITDYPVNTPEGEANTYALRFVPESWAITATAKNTMLIKNLNSTWAELTAAFGTTPADWINGDHRSYWARSYGYMDGIGIIGNPTFPEVGSDESGDYLLDYKSYKDVSTSLWTSEGTDASYVTMANTEPVYVGENTMRGARFSNPADFPNPYASVTSAIIKGHYEVTGDDAEKFADGFYIRSLSKVDEQGVTVQVNAIYNDTELRTAMLKGQPYFRTTAPAEDETEYTTDPGAVAITHLNNATDITGAVKKNPANRVTIQIPATYTGTLYIPETDATGTTTWNEVAAADRTAKIEEINKDLEKFAGQASAYANGAAFFYVPIKHNSTESSAYIETPVTGDYGIVRNHSYQLTINNISGLATGVLDENDKPIPDPTPTQTYFINATLNVLAWHIMGNSVDL